MLSNFDYLIHVVVFVRRLTDRLARLEDMFKSYWKSVNPDFQTEHDYGPETPGSSNLALGAAQMCHRHDCVAFTLEMPFKVREYICAVVCSDPITEYTV